MKFYTVYILFFLQYKKIYNKWLYFSNKRTGSFKLFLFCIFWLIHDPWPFPHLHSSAHLIFYASDLFKLHINTSNYLDMLLNFFSTLSCSSTTLCGLLKSFSIICTSTYLLSHTLEVSTKYSSSLLFQFLYSELFLIT